MYKLLLLILCISFASCGSSEKDIPFPQAWVKNTREMRMQRWEERNDPAEWVNRTALERLPSLYDRSFTTDTAKVLSY